MKNHLTTLKTKNKAAAIRNILIISIAILLAMYIVFQIRWLIGGPPITIIEPVHGSVTSKPIITVIGKSPRAINATVNGVKTPIDTAGFFALNVVVPIGISNITVTTENRYKKISTKTIMIQRNKPEI
jgi:hypothetical protein